MRSLVISFLGFVALVLSAQLGHAAVAWPNLNKACLPEQGRMVRSFNWQTGADRNPLPACHCPPQSYCPQNLGEWQTHPRMPARQAQICCPAPAQAQCTVNNSFTSSFCATGFSITPMTFCVQYSSTKSTNCANRCLAKYDTSKTLTANQWVGLQNCLNNCASQASPAKCQATATFNECTTCNVRDNVGGDPDGEGDCLPLGTMVLSSAGVARPIEQFVQGESVKGNTKENRLQEVLLNEVEGVELYTINKNLITLTAGHPIMTTKGWRVPDPAKLSDEYKKENIMALAVGDKLITLNGEVEVTEIEKTLHTGKIETYNLRLYGDQTYYANGVLVRDN